MSYSVCLSFTLKSNLNDYSISALNGSAMEYDFCLLRERKRQHDLRIIVNTIFYVVRTGIQWRNLTSAHPPWTAVYYYFYQWSRDGTLAMINTALNQLERERQGKDDTPSLTCVDSQSTKLAPMIGADRGKDGNKLVNGRKRQVMVDTLGLVWAVYVHAANESDSKAGCNLLPFAKKYLPRLIKILIDSGYKETFIQEVKAVLDIEAEVTSRPETIKGFVPLAKRWVSERTFGWFNYFRRLTKDYERTTKSAEGMILLANITIILNRIV